MWMSWIKAWMCRTNRGAVNVPSINIRDGRLPYVMASHTISLRVREVYRRKPKEGLRHSPQVLHTIYGCHYYPNCLLIRRWRKLVPFGCGLALHVRDGTYDGLPCYWSGVGVLRLDYMYAISLIHWSETLLTVQSERPRRKYTCRVDNRTSVIQVILILSNSGSSSYCLQWRCSGIIDEKVPLCTE